MSENEAILRRWIDEVWNSGKLETVEELFDENGVAIYEINPPDRPIRGVEEFKKFYRQLSSRFSDIFVTIQEMSDNSEKVVATCTVSANRIQKDGDGNVTKKFCTISGLCQLKIFDGKIFEAWNNLDFSKAEL